LRIKVFDFCILLLSCVFSSKSKKAFN
jgi:hypothetical protein